MRPFLRPGRRSMVRATALLGLLWPFRGLAAVEPVPSAGGAALASLGSWLDTLIPADATPSATSLGVDTSLLGRAEREVGLMRLLEAGCRWLDVEAYRRGAASFVALPEAQREAIAGEAAAAPPRSLQRVFFDNSWAFASFFYYGHRDSWASLGYAGPPQPAGFVDQDRPPA